MILHDLLGVLLSVFVLLLVLRFFVQFAGISAHDPMAGAIYQTTRFVDVFSSIFPTVNAGRVSLAALALLFLVQVVELSLGFSARPLGGLSPMGLLVFSIFDFASLIISSCKWIIIASVVVSWIVALSGKVMPVVRLVLLLAEPILAPFRRISPNLGMIDISPIFAFFALYLIEMLLMGLRNSLVM